MIKAILSYILRPCLKKDKKFRKNDEKENKDTKPIRGLKIQAGIQLLQRTLLACFHLAQLLL